MNLWNKISGFFKPDNSAVTQSKSTSVEGSSAGVIGDKTRLKTSPGKGCGVRKGLKLTHPARGFNINLLQLTNICG